MEKVHAPILSDSVNSPALPAHVRSGKTERLGYLGMALFVGSLLFAPGDDAHAATLTVNSLADNTTPSDGKVTLREALAVANFGGTTDLGETSAYPGADEIVFDSSITGAPGVIHLQYGTLRVMDDLTITGPGPDLLALDGGGIYQILSAGYVDPSDEPLARAGSAVRNLTVSGLTFQNGYSFGFRRATRARGGGAIYAGGADLVVDDCVITGNASLANGGGIFFAGYSGNLIVTNSILSGNTAGYDGGGLYAMNARNVMIDNSSITGNTAYESGGGVAESRCGLSMIDTCLFDGNTATNNSGGGLSMTNTSAPLLVLNSVISNNEADYSGGGLFVYAGSYIGPDAPLAASTRRPTFLTGDAVSLFGTVIAGNTCAYQGGGLAIFAKNNPSDIIIDTCLVSGNLAEYAAGALLVNAKAYFPYYFDNQFKILNSKVHNNFASNAFGGLLFANNVSSHPQALLVDRTTVSCNFAAGAVGFGGGGISIISTLGVATIQNSTLSGNGAYLGGGLNTNLTTSPVTLANSTISGNFAFAGGGASLGLNGRGYYPTFLNNCTVADNQAYFGGGIASGSVAVVLAGSIVSGNYAYSEGNDLYSFAFTPPPPDPLLPVVPRAPVRPTFLFTYSLVEDPYDVYYSADPQSILGSSAYLEPLANNGGQTKTHALSISSPAIDAGLNAAFATFDQRGIGYPRTVNGQTDMGAYEYNPDAPPPEQLFGFGNDSDGDGFSDDAEAAAGTDPDDPLDSPIGTVLLNADQLAPLSILKLTVSLNFSKPERDAVKLKGRFELPDGTPIAGQAVLVDVAGSAAGFVLSGNPRGATGVSGSSKIKVGAPRGGVASFTLSMKGDFQDAFALNADMQNETTPKVGEGKIVRVALAFGTVGAFRTDVVVSYKAKQDKTGKAK